MPSDENRAANWDNILILSTTNPILLNSSTITDVYNIYKRKCFGEVIYHILIHLRIFANPWAVNNNYTVLQNQKWLLNQK